jgi:hypothetical protein
MEVARNVEYREPRALRQGATWRRKMRRWLGLGTVALGLSLALGGCTSHKRSGGTQGAAGDDGDDDNRVCSPGATQVCVGPGACSGGQVCVADGSRWAACECGGNEGGADGIGGSENASGTGTGGAGTSGSGTSGSGTSGSGTGGSVGPDVCPAIGSTLIIDPLISDFEGDTPLQTLLVPNGGAWMAESDGTGTISATVEEDATAAGQHALHFVGSNHTNWGGDVAVLFEDVTHAVNGNAHAGVGFRVRGTISGGALYVKLQNADSLVKGCGCDPSPAAASAVACYGGYISESLVGAQYATTTQPWAAFMPGPFGYHARSSIDPNHILSMAIVVQSLSPSVSWDLWIDDVSFY